ncbi:MAG: HlyC/CorC family transporter [Candidatus Sericytochromatia bacterium]|uniref:HlyC/CorC family transporter n=1 Tax=Candidatus Tanganyikabacteria bacterium TaxID=2961651 RepID=A0A938BP46_9BACT|nr:HlyC/CorC family transporter [Candidatus Tanganyikabacteria bacterium]
MVANAVLLVLQWRILRGGKRPEWFTRLIKAGTGNGHAPGPLLSRAITTVLNPAVLDMPEASPEDQRIVHKAMTFSEKTVGEVMVPRPDMICVGSSAHIRDVLLAAARSSHSRIPVHDGDLDHIVGFVHAKDLIKLAADSTKPLVASEIMRPILAVPENKSINEMLRDFQQNKTHVAIVIDEFGGTSGMVTINDLLEELVGEIFDEVRGGQPDYEVVSDGTVRLSGRMAIVDVNERFGLALPDDEFNTIAGLVFGCLGRTPFPGDVVEMVGVRFKVEATNGRRATQLVLQK